MVKRNKSKAKQRKKRYLKKRIIKSPLTESTAQAAPVAKPIPSTQLQLSTYRTVNRDYQAVLDGLFDRKIIVVDRYLNENASTIFFCRECKNRFYAKGAFLTSGIQPHVCFSGKFNPYSSAPNTTKLKKVKDATWDEFQTMVQADLTFQEIAKKMQVNPVIIKTYFEVEGLL